MTDDIPRKMTHLRVAVVSPGDVTSERDAIEDIIETVNRNTAQERGIWLDLWRWEDDSHPTFHPNGPQGAIDSQLRIDQCQIVIGIFWARFGTPVGDADSGTEHELRLAYESWKKKRRPIIMIYFNSEPVVVKSVEEAEQLMRVLEFKKGVPPEALYGEYKGAQDFVRRLHNDLTHVIREFNLDDFRVTAPPTAPPTVARPTVGWRDMTLDSAPLYTLSGLQVEPRDDDLFQDFRIDRQRYINPNPVSYLWADVYRGGAINASVVEADPPHLSITFENKPASWPCNLAIRPIRERAVLTGSRNVLAFEARVASETGPEGSLDEVSVSVRVVNGYFQHWVYGPRGRFRLLQIDKDWKSLEVSLDDDWWLFNSDGNTHFGPREKDLSIIASVVLELGSTDIDRPGAGRATVLIRNIHFKS